MGPSGKIPHPLPPMLLFPPFFLDLKTVWQKTLLIAFFLIKNNTATSSPSVHPFRLALPGAEAGGGIVEGQARAALGAVGLLGLEQRHGELRPGPQPLQAAEPAAVVELLAEPWAAVPQGELLHQPWLHGPEEVEP